MRVLSAIAAFFLWLAVMFLSYRFGAFDAEHLRNAYAYAQVGHQAGANMIPAFGWNQAGAAWSASKAGK